jgi:hypothetical protein
MWPAKSCPIPSARRLNRPSFAVIASAAKQSRETPANTYAFEKTELDCFAALAMTGGGQSPAKTALWRSGTPPKLPVSRGKQSFTY